MVECICTYAIRCDAIRFDSVWLFQDYMQPEGYRTRQRFAFSIHVSHPTNQSFKVVLASFTPLKSQFASEILRPSGRTLHGLSLDMELLSAG
jgi:hypothetical protein